MASTAATVSERAIFASRKPFELVFIASFNICLSLHRVTTAFETGRERTAITTRLFLDARRLGVVTLVVALLNLFGLRRAARIRGCSERAADDRATQRARC